MTQLSATQRAETVLAPLRLSKEKMEELRTAFKDELLRGLEMHKKHGLKWVPEECSLRMLDSCVSQIPTGDEVGVFYALDFGGTNVRAVRCELVGGGKIVSQQSLKNLYECGGDIDLMSRDTSASLLFDVLAGSVEELMKENKDKHNLKDKPAKLGFTFSFPCAQSHLNNSVLESWTKGFATGHDTDDPVVGKDVVELLTAAIKRKSLPLECAAVVNDTVGTLLSCAYQKGRSAAACTIGVILGTGANCCYIEPDAAQFGYKGSIINVECGNFNKHLPTTPVDQAIDNKSPNKGHQLFEKMISGFYIGELFRLLSRDIFGDKAPAKASEEFSIDARHTSVLAATCVPDLKVTDADLNKCVGVIKECWDYTPSLEELEILRQVAFAVFDRSAALAAISIAVLAERTKSLENGGGLTVAVDGSLYVRNAWYGRQIEHHLKSLLGEEAQKRITLRAADDGSGKGAAICVAALH